MTGGIFALLDDIAMLMDDTASTTKLAIKQTTPLLGDDLAVNAEKASGYHASRELPVLWAITKGSFKNKLIILPFAFILSATIPWLIPIILVIGGLYLAYEGAEVVHHYIQSKISHTQEHHKIKTLTEEQKIKSAIFTDFILSIEIIVVALGSVIEEPLMIQIVSVSIVAFLATVGVYGIVAFLVRMDDMGYAIIQKSEQGSFKEKFGNWLVLSLPKVIKVLSFIGTIAMLLVAGGIFIHNIEPIHHFYHEHLVMIPSLVIEMILALGIGYIIFFIEQIVVPKKD